MPGLRSHAAQPALRCALAAALATSALACATPVGVEPVDAKRLHRDLTRSVISADEPSETSIQALQRLNLGDLYRKQPEQALARMHEQLVLEESRDLLAALAELSFDHAERTDDRRHFLAAAVYAYAFLFPSNGAPPPDPLDPRVRLQANLYNRGLTEGFSSAEGPMLSLAAGRYELPWGVLELAADPDEFRWADHRLVHFYPVAEVEVRGLSNRYRRPGIGAALSAELEPDPETPARPASEHIPRNLKVPVTAFVRMHNLPRATTTGIVQAELELYTAELATTTRVAGRDVPLEIEGSSSLAFTLSDRSIWDFELKGFFSGDFYPSGEKDGLLMLYPHRPGRVPVVLVHGTASSPGRWAELINEIQNDDEIRERVDVWLFLYNTGNPIAYSAGRLRSALQQVVLDLDPEGREEALNRMVLIGHSQGGLLAKMLTIDSGDRFWNNVSPVPIDELDIEPETGELLRDALFFERLPNVTRVIFVSTPHRGSFLASYRLSGLLKRFTSVSSRLVTVVPDLLINNPNSIAERNLNRMPTSIDNMTPNHRFVRTISAIPVDEDVHAHSIIAVRGSGPPEKGDDGVVTYQSAHIEEAESERIVTSGHSAQGHPDTVNEVKRILRVHLASP